MSNGCSKCKRSTDERCPLIFRFIIRLHGAEVSRPYVCQRTSPRSKSDRCLSSGNTKRQSRLAPRKHGIDEWHSRALVSSHSITDSPRTKFRNRLDHSAPIGTPPIRLTFLAIRSDVFFSLNGLQNWPLLADYDFVQRLRQLDPIMITQTSTTVALHCRDETFRVPCE